MNREQVTQKLWNARLASALERREQEIQAAEEKYEKIIGTFSHLQGPGGWDDGTYLWTPLVMKKGDEFDYDIHRWVVEWGTRQGILFRYSVEMIGVYRHEFEIGPFSQKVNGTLCCAICQGEQSQHDNPHHPRARKLEDGTYALPFEVYDGVPSDPPDQNWYLRHPE